MSASHRPKKKKKQANQNNIFDIIGTVIVASSVVAVLSSVTVPSLAIDYLCFEYSNTVVCVEY